jgi:hypothetical protein
MARLVRFVQLNILDASNHRLGTNLRQPRLAFLFDS